MKLIPSLLLTALITLAVWLALWWQTQSASSHTEAANTAVVPQRYLVGITATLPLDDVEQLWQRYYQQHQPPSKAQSIIVYYRSFDSEFAMATITIGTLHSGSEPPEAAVRIPAQSELLVLLTEDQHSAVALAEAWQQIDYRRTVRAVIERHQLNQHGYPNRSEMLVQY